MNLDDIRKRAEAATPGPWWAWDRGVGWHIALGHESDRDEYGRPQRLLPEAMRTDIDRAEDAEFIAHARQDIPALLAEVERLTRESAASTKRAAAIGAVRRLCRQYPVDSIAINVLEILDDSLHNGGGGSVLPSLEDGPTDAVTKLGEES